MKALLLSTGCMAVATKEHFPDGIGNTMGPVILVETYVQPSL